MKRCSILLLAAITTSCASASFRNDSSAKPPLAVALLVPAEARIPVVTLRGSPEALGTQQGEKLHDAIVELHDQYLLKFISTGSSRLAAMAAATLFENQLTPEYRDEVHALATATNLPERDVMLAQCFLDLLPATACSIVTTDGIASSDGIARFGRNLDFPSLGVADKHSVILVYHPTEKTGAKFAFAAVSWPGMIGVLSGMNEYGLCVANAEVPRSLRWPSALPYTLLYRTVLENCRTVSEAIALLNSSSRQSSNNLMLMDAAGDRAVAEITPEAVTVRRAPSTQPLMCTNTHRGGDGDSHGDRRYDVLLDESRALFGSLSVPSIERILHDASQGNFTLQSMILEPSTRTLYLSVGKNATTRPYVRYDLSGVLKTVHE